jgi:hypothetical protein
LLDLVEKERREKLEQLNFKDEIISLHEQDVNDYLNIISSHEREKQQLYLEIEALRNKEVPIQLQQKSSDAEEDFKKIFQVLLPNLIFERGSIAFIVNQVQDYRGILRKLGTLSIDPADFGAIGSKRVQTAKRNWLEISHVSIGSSDCGRIYYSKSDKTGQYHLLVSHKDEQKRDIEKLKKLDI